MKSIAILVVMLVVWVPLSRVLCNPRFPEDTEDNEFAEFEEFEEEGPKKHLDSVQNKQSSDEDQGDSKIDDGFDSDPDIDGIVEVRLS